MAMKLLGQDVRRPGLAFWIYFALGALLAKYGIIDGSLLLFDVFGGIFIYKILTSQD